MRILLVGDTHGSQSAVKAAFNDAAELSCDKIFQLGDFGFWPKSTSGRKFLETTDGLAKTTGIPFYWLAGNHEDWNDLDIVFATYLKDEDGFHIYENLRIAPRSNVWVWDSMRFANLSGAFSIDKKYRTENLDWFSQEQPQMTDLAHLAERMKEKGIEEVDVMLAHDAPENLFKLKGEWHRVFVNPVSDQSQAVHAAAVETMKPQVYIHGHWHLYYKYYFDHTYCVALDQTSKGTGAWSQAVLDTTNKTLDIVGPGVYPLHDLS